ncbi:GATA transcription factor [Musa troglodytarum]|uniref:GATA transcription factor n=1 Tax=Musa troglodytarum TaxID=320322 RepID=A0A9E7KDF3_9LILI|nr:GATA transcription factor [Musa troglodytarum]
MDRSDMDSCDANPRSSDRQIKSCTDCRATKTPLWRAGPTGPKSLCNACGIRYRKKVKEAGMKVKKKKKKKREISGGRGRKRFGVYLKMQMSGLGLWKQRSMIQKRRRRRNVLGEEEQAAVLLMALSSGLL